MPVRKRQAGIWLRMRSRRVRASDSSLTPAPRNASRLRRTDLTYAHASAGRRTSSQSAYCHRKVMARFAAARRGFKLYTPSLPAPLSSAQNLKCPPPSSPELPHGRYLHQLPPRR